MFERLAFDAGVRGTPRLRVLRVPPIGTLAPLVAEVCAAWTEATREGEWDELGVRLAAAAVRFASEPKPHAAPLRPTPSAASCMLCSSSSATRAGT